MPLTNPATIFNNPNICILGYHFLIQQHNRMILGARGSYLAFLLNFLKTLQLDLCRHLSLRWQCFDDFCI